MGVFCYDKRDNVGFTWILTTQWINYAAKINVDGSITFPLSFKSKILVISAQEVALNAQGNGFDFQAYNPSLEGVKYRWDDQSGNHNGLGASCTIHVLVLGI